MTRNINITDAKAGTRLQKLNRRKAAEISTAVTPISRARLSYPIVVFSHLCWDWVWQRPQQFLSRLAEQHPVLFVEGPVPTKGLRRARPTLREVPEFPNLLIMQMAVPASRWND